jgi:hypothetical protein
MEDEINLLKTSKKKSKVDITATKYSNFIETTVVSALSRHHLYSCIL